MMPGLPPDVKKAALHDARMIGKSAAHIFRKSEKAFQQLDEVFDGVPTGEPIMLELKQDDDSEN